MPAFVFKARIRGTLTTTAFAIALRLGATSMSTSSSAVRFRALLVATTAGATGFFSKSSSGSDVSGVSGSTEFALLRDTELLVVVVVVAGVLELRPRFLVWTMVGQREGDLEDRGVARRKLTRRVPRLLLIGGAGTAIQIWYYHVIRCLCATSATPGMDFEVTTGKLKAQQHSGFAASAWFAQNSLIYLGCVVTCGICARLHTAWLQARPSRANDAK